MHSTSYNLPFASAFSADCVVAFKARCASVAGQDAEANRSPRVVIAELLLLAVGCP